MKLNEAIEEIRALERTARTYSTTGIGDDKYRKEMAEKAELYKLIADFVDKVTGEPSEGMIEATITSFNDNGKLALVSHAKSYINQARKEVEDRDWETKSAINL
jgi:hypothetical protein